MKEIAINKYVRVYNFVCRFAEDPLWRAFFISFLLAETEEERTTLGQRFWKEVSGMAPAEQEKVRLGFDLNFKKLLPLADDLLVRVKAAKRENAVVMAA